MARSFNGTSDLITWRAAGSGNNLIPSTNPWSASAWINLTTNSGSFQCIVAYRNAAGQTNFEMFIETGLGAYNGTNFTTFGTMGTAAWNHCLVACDSTSFICYVNGSSLGTATNNYGAGNTGGFGSVTGTIGADSSPAQEFFPGRIADVAVWSAKLTAAEALSLSQGARPVNIRTASLLVWWPLDGIQSPEPDLGGGANNGTLTGTTSIAGPPIMQFTPRWPLNSLSASSSSTGTSFQPAWVMRNRIVVDGIGI